MVLSILKILECLPLLVAQLVECCPSTPVRQKVVATDQCFSLIPSFSLSTPSHPTPQINKHTFLGEDLKNIYIYLSILIHQYVGTSHSFDFLAGNKAKSMCN